MRDDDQRTRIVGEHSGQRLLGAQVQMVVGSSITISSGRSSSPRQSSSLRSSPARGSPPSAACPDRRFSWATDDSTRARCSAGSPVSRVIARRASSPVVFWAMLSVRTSAGRPQQRPDDRGLAQPVRTGQTDMVARANAQQRNAHTHDCLRHGRGRRPPPRRATVRHRRADASTSSARASRPDAVSGRPPTPVIDGWVSPNLTAGADPDSEARYGRGVHPDAPRIAWRDASDGSMAAATRHNGRRPSRNSHPIG